MSDLILEGEGGETAIELQGDEPLIIEAVQVEIVSDAGQS